MARDGALGCGVGAVMGWLIDFGVRSDRRA